MKYFVLSAALLMLTLFSCKSDDDGSGCVTCESSDPFFGLDISNEYCQQGDDVQLTVTALGVSSDTLLLNTTVDVWVSQEEAGGASCN